MHDSLRSGLGSNGISSLQKLSLGHTTLPARVTHYLAYLAQDAAGTAKSQIDVDLPEP